MIDIVEKKDCCGCEACVSACPVKCISFANDGEGFAYPKADPQICINCGLCERVCPELNRGNSCKPIDVLAACNPCDTVRKSSSSGGIFTMLAEKVISEGGVVFGARFAADYTVEHAKAETIEDLAAFRGSKYMQSRIGQAFAEAKRCLVAGQKVMFTGTPCQISGLKLYLRREYDNLLAVDVVCHGVPSAAVWQRYLSECIAPLSSICGVNFRDKSEGWKDYSVKVSFKEKAAKHSVSSRFVNNPYMRVFLANLDLRPSCYDCPVKSGRSGSDITLGDFWGIESINSEAYDNRGVSLVLINTMRGMALFDSFCLHAWNASYRDAVKYNPSLENSVSEPIYRRLFMKRFEQAGFNAAYVTVCSTSPLRRIYRRLWSKVHPK